MVSLFLDMQVCLYIPILDGIMLKQYQVTVFMFPQETHLHRNIKKFVQLETHARNAALYFETSCSRRKHYHV